MLVEQSSRPWTPGPTRIRERLYLEIANHNSLRRRSLLSVGDKMPGKRKSSVGDKMPAKRKRARNSRHGRRRWSDLPIDLLCSILHLLPIKEVIRFGAVCPHWRSAFTAVKKKLSFGPSLMLQVKITRTNTFLTSAHDSRPYTIRLAVNNFSRPSRHSIIGSSNGWLITLRFPSYRRQVHMLDPHTGAQLQLPPVPMTHSSSVVAFDKAIVVPPSPAREEYMVATITYMITSNHGLAVAQAGGDRWILFEAPPLLKGSDLLEDINYNDGMLYAVCLNGNVAVWELSSSNESPTLKEFLRGPELKSFDSMVHRELHIVPGSQHGLLLIARYCHRDPLTDVFDVFTLGSNGQCERITCLGECSFFLGLYSQSMCLSAVDFPELKENCIYFIEKSGSFLYSLEDGKIYEGNQSCNSMRVRNAIWVMPNLK